MAETILPQRPRIVCLCGSTRFPDAWKQAHREESLAGRIVLSVGVMIHAGDEPIRADGPQKQLLDELHLRKIDLADEVLVLNVGGYIGESTSREVAYAREHGKPVRFLEPLPTADEVYGILSPAHPRNGGPGFDEDGTEAAGPRTPVQEVPRVE